MTTITNGELFTSATVQVNNNVCFFYRTTIPMSSLLISLLFRYKQLKVTYTIYKVGDLKDFIEVAHEFDISKESNTELFATFVLILFILLIH